LALHSFHGLIPQRAEAWARVAGLATSKLTPCTTGAQLLRAILLRSVVWFGLSGQRRLQWPHGLTIPPALLATADEVIE
jgi:hypothetical protein